MISKKLKEWKYYYDKFPLYFKNDENIISHFKILYDLLVDLDDLYEEIFKFLDIFNINNASEIQINENILDMLGAIYNVNRNITFDFELNIVSNEIVKTEGVSTNISLNNNEFMILIEAQIIKNNYNGTYKDINTYYNYINKSIGKNICIKDSNDTPGRAIVLLIEEPKLTDINYYYLLYAGLLTVESAGIEYVYDVSNTMNYSYWNQTNWNEGRWF